jgi:hypothetical protein
MSPLSYPALFLSIHAAGQQHVFVAVKILSVFVAPTGTGVERHGVFNRYSISIIVLASSDLVLH